MLENTAYNSPHIRPLEVSPPTYPGSVQKPWGFFFGACQRQADNGLPFAAHPPLGSTPSHPSGNGRTPGAFSLALAKVGSGNMTGRPTLRPSPRIARSTLPADHSVDANKMPSQPTP